MNESTSNDYDQDEQRLLIKDGLEANVSQYPPSEASIYPIIDGLKLLNQFPHALSFYAEKPTGEKEVLYTTLQDPELTGDLVRTIKEGEVGKNFQINNGIDETDGRLHVCRHRIEEIKQVPHDGLDAEFSLLDVSSGDLENLVGALEDDAYSRKQVLDPLLSSIKNYLNGETDANEKKRQRRVGSIIETKAQEAPREYGSSDRQSESSTNRTLVADWVDKQLRPMRGVLDNAYATVEDSYLLKGQTNRSGKAGEEGLFNLFCAVRTATCLTLRRDKFNYTARVLLSNKQRRNLGPLFNETEAELDHIEYELGHRARSIADTCFYSGTIDFSPEEAGEGRDFSGTSERDEKRTAAEELLYNTISEDRRPFFVPIHIAGVPWLVLYTFPQSDSDWRRNYQIYRTLIPKIAAKLRVGSLNTYVNLLADRFASKLAREGEGTLLHDLSDLNGAWHDLALVYPFARMQLSTDADDGRDPGNDAFELPSGKKVFVRRAEGNPYFETQVSYGNPEETLVENVVAELEERTRAIRDTRIKTKSEVSLLSAHDLKNVITRTTIEPLSSVKEEGLPSELKPTVERAIARAKGGREQLSLLLETYAELQAGYSCLELDESIFKNLFSPESLRMESYEKLPEIKKNICLMGASKIVLDISRNSLTGVIMILVRNAIESLLRKERDPGAHTVYINARLNEASSVCTFKVQNTGTRFGWEVMEQAGHSIIGNPNPGSEEQGTPGGAGLGFYLFNSLLRRIDAPKKGKSYFDLENISLEGSSGVQVSFGIPVESIKG